jgi:hypothetical protein
MSAIFESIKHEFASRKFRAMLGGVLGLIVVYLAEGSDVDTTLYRAIMLIVAYVLGIAVEDGLTARASRATPND